MQCHYETQFDVFLLELMNALRVQPTDKSVIYWQVTN